ncbi:hypothetical protein XU18_4631 [Perkinsela sp. CCAP 1560/4]|nr:hypothetical protein XU18_4631 [Perkinsela sp. CCAP 1560/4]|eukprot:KNH04063.1 hypothetical protein XU18_4631 [Perkinsela sp. CCAP 1560/4]
MQVTPGRRPVRPGLACQAVEETSTSKVLCLGRFDADRSSSMRFACFQLCGRVIRYFRLGDAESILMPEGIAGAAPMCWVRSCIGELVSRYPAVSKDKLQFNFYTSPCAELVCPQGQTHSATIEFPIDVALCEISWKKDQCDAI